MRAFRLPPALLLFLLVALAYWPVVHCGFIWDDDDYVTHNPVLRSLGGIARIWFEPTSLPQYYPLVHTTFWLEYRLWGPSPLGYHVGNVLLHLLSSIALLHLLRRLLVPGALLAAALFAVHPVHVESVAWVTERKNVLSLLCALLAAHQWLSFHDSGRARSWWIATAWFTAALLAKTVVASLPAALLVVQWWRNGRLDRRTVLSTLPWLALGAAFGLFTAYLEATHVRASGEPWQLVGAERLLVAGRTIWFYLGSLLWPIGLCFNYPRWQLDTGSPLQWLPVAAAVAAPLVAIALRHRIGRGPAAALLLFGGILMPALGFFDVYPFRFSFVADHFQYHASIAVLVLLAAGLATATARWFSARVAGGLAGGLATALLVLLAILASTHTRNYRDLETSWRTTLACNPDSVLALINLGGLLLQRNELAEAKQCFERCLQLDADNYESLANLGQIAHRDNDTARARQFYERTLQLRPEHLPTLNNFAILHLQQNRPEEARQLAQRAVDGDPDYYDGRTTLTWALHALGRWQESLIHADWVLLRTPEAMATRLQAAQCFLALGNFQSAVQNAAVVLAQSPAAPDVQIVFARALAGVLRTFPTAGLAERVDQICRSGGIDARPLMARIQNELRALGAPAHADALLQAGRGR